MPQADTTPPQAARYRFADVSVDLGLCRTTRGGRTLPLGKLTFDLLVALVEAAPSVITHDALAARVWKRRLVTPETIVQRVKLLRRALDDDASAPRYIEVVRGQGYRLIPTVDRIADTPELDITDLALAHAARPKLQTALVGREQELGALREARTAIEQGSGRVVLIAGEPGIGKTHLAEAFVAEAETAGATALFGRCNEERGSPPYWPWLQALATAAQALSEPELATILAADGEVAAFAESASSPSTIRADGPSRARQVLFHDIVRRLGQCAQTRPIVIVFDNLHWADQPSLRLLEFLGRALASCRIMIVGTYRDTEISRKHALFETLGALGRDAIVERVRLRGLPEQDVRTIVERTVGQSVSAKLVAEIHRQTDGNPFFVTEVARVIAEELTTARGERITVRVPDGIREAIGRHLNRLSDRCNELLAVAAVIGRAFDVRQLEALVGAPAMEVLARLEEALAAGLVEETRQLGRFQFTHALVAETLYDELSLSRRVALHRDVARTFERLHGDRIEPFLGQIARHYHYAAQAGDVDRAVGAALAAAEHAERMHADEEAIGYYGLALELFALDAVDHRRDEAVVQLAIGRARWRAGAPWQVTARIFETALACARECGDRECFIEAVCEYIYTSVPATTQKSVDYFDEALGLAAPDDLVSRARLMSRKAFALHTLGRYAEAEPAAYEAVNVARRSGDAWGMCDTFAWGLLVLRARPETLAERIRLGEEALELARALGDFETERSGAVSHLMSRFVSARRGHSRRGAFRPALWAAYEAQRWLLLCYQEAGDMPRVKAIAAELGASIAKHSYLKHDHFLYYSASTEALCALMDGRWDEAREHILRTYKLGTATDEAGAEGVFSAQMFHLHRELGQLRQFEPILRRFVNDGTRAAWSPGLALMYTELGDIDAARVHFDASLSDGVAALPWSELRVTSLAFLAETCVAIGDKARACELYAALSPYSGQMVIHPTAVSLGPADRYLGAIAQLLGRTEAATEHFERALAQCAAAQSRPWLAHTQYAFACAHAAADDYSRAGELIASTRATAEQLGMRNLLEKIERTPWLVRIVEPSKGGVAVADRRRGVRLRSV